MARIASIAAGLALLVAQPVATALAQPTEQAATQTNDNNYAGTPFFKSPGKIVIALGALSAVTWGLVNAFKGSGGGRRPASP